MYTVVSRKSYPKYALKIINTSYFENKNVFRMTLTDIRSCIDLD